MAWVSNKTPFSTEILDNVVQEMSWRPHWSLKSVVSMDFIVIILLPQSRGK